MISKSQLIELFKYDEWAYLKLLDTMIQLDNKEFICDLSNSFNSIRDTMVHILGAEELWLSRWMGEQGRTLLNSDDFADNDSLVKRWSDFRKLFNNFLESLPEDDLVKEISYKNLKGIPYSLEIVEANASCN